MTFPVVQIEMYYEHVHTLLWDMNVHSYGMLTLIPYTVTEINIHTFQGIFQEFPSRKANIAMKIRMHLHLICNCGRTMFHTFPGDN